MHIWLVFACLCICFIFIYEHIFVCIFLHFSQAAYSVTCIFQVLHISAYECMLMHIHGLHLKGCTLNDVESAILLSRIHKKRTDSFVRF